MTTHSTPGAGEQAPPPPDFDPVSLRFRRDGWTPDRQIAFIRALAECGCVREACRRVGMSAEGAYELARRPDAQSFRIAWDVAMDQAVRRIGDGAFSRAINCIEIPHFYKGELVGTHRRYDERLTMFILRTRDPLRFGKHLEQGTPLGCREDRALDLAAVLAWARSDAQEEAQGRPRRVFPHLGGAANDDDEGVASPRNMVHVYAYAPHPVFDDDEDDGDGAPDQQDEEAEAISDEQAEAMVVRMEARIRAVFAGAEDDDGDWLAEARAQVAGTPLPPDGARASSTSARGTVTGNCPPSGAGPHPNPAHPQLPQGARLAGDSPSPIGSP